MCMTGGRNDDVPRRVDYIYTVAITAVKNWGRRLYEWCEGSKYKRLQFLLKRGLQSEIYHIPVYRNLALVSWDRLEGT